MVYSLCQLLTNADGNLLGHGEVDYSALSTRGIDLGHFNVPFNILVTYTHQALLKDYHRGEEITDNEVLQYWYDMIEELQGAGSLDNYNHNMRLR